MGRISLGAILQVLGIKLVAIVDDEAYAPLQARLKPAKFHRWNLEPLNRSNDTPPARGMKIGLNQIGSVAEVARVPELRAAVSVRARRRSRRETRPWSRNRRAERGLARRDLNPADVSGMRRQLSPAADIASDRLW